MQRKDHTQNTSGNLKVTDFQANLCCTIIALQTWHLYGEHRQLDLVDVNVKSSSYSKEEVLRMINVGLLCIQANPTLRPSMSTIVGMLEGKIDVNVSNCQPPYLSSKQPDLFAEEKPLSHGSSLEGPWKGSSSYEESSIVQQEIDDNDENSLILNQVSADLYPVSISELTPSQSYT